MATLVVPVTTNFSAVALNDIDTIIFPNAPAATATFLNTQFNNVAIRNTVLIDGVAPASGHQPNTIVVNGGSLNASGWTFSNWAYFNNLIRLNGSAGADTIIGSSMRDLIYGGGGGDTLNGGDDDDSLYGGDGDDTLDGGMGTDGLYGGAANDMLFGGVSDDGLYGGAGADALYGGDGNDTLVGEAGADAHYGGNGSDTAYYYAATGGINVNLATGAATGDVAEGDTFNSIEKLSGGQFNDTLTGDGGYNEIYGNAGNDTMTDGGVNYIDGGEGDDMLINTFADVFAFGGNNWEGGEGNDTIDLSQNYASSSFAYHIDLSWYNFTLTGGVYWRFENVIGMQSSNWMTGSAGANILTGGAEADVISGGGGGDTVNGGGGNDFLSGGEGGDIINGGAGVDTLSFAGSSQAVTVSLDGSLAGAGDAAGDQITAIENLEGTDFGDRLAGSAGGNVLNGFDGADNMSGGAGSDFYYVNTSADVVNEAAAAGFDTMFSSSGNTIAVNVERLYLLGDLNYNANGRNGQNDFLAGNSGDNVLNGFSGNDTIRGGYGHDTLTGGLGLDIFQFLTAPHAAGNADTITDFNPADDTIQLDNLVYRLLTATGTLAAALFKNLSLGPQDANDVILYDQVNGNLFYDTNGLTAGGVSRFAEVNNGVPLTAADFVVV